MLEGIVIGGIDTYRDLGLVLGSKELSPPPLKRYEVDVPGGDGSIDFTDAVGGPAYGMREHSFAFSFMGGGFEEAKTRVSNLFHGRRFDYTLPWDPGYVYTGRFEVDEYETSGALGRIVLKVSADPYKRRPPVTLRVNAAGGVEVVVPSGRMPACPVIEVSSRAIVDYEGASHRLEPGASRIPGLWLSMGGNRLVVNTAPDHGSAVWADLGAEAWRARAGDRLSDLAALGEPLQEQMRWADMAGSWAEAEPATWQEAAWPADPSNEQYQAYIHYEWGDL